MHIGYITSEYPHPKVVHSAGIGTSLKNLAISLVTKGIQVSIFVYNQENNLIFEDKGAKIHLIEKKRHTLFTWYFYRKNIQNYVNKFIEKEQISILEAPDWTGITAFMKFKIPLIIRFHGSDAYFCMLDGRKQKFKNKWFEEMALKRATAYLAPTSFAGEETAKIFNLDKKKIRTIHYGLNICDFDNKTPSKFNESTILYIGTIIRKKGVFELAQIFNKVIESNPEAKLILIGSDSPDLKTGSPSTYKLVEREFKLNAKKQVNYLGEVPYSKVKEHIKNAHVCAFPSFAETLGMVTIESMALQKPVINSSIGWAQELIDDGVNGYLVHPNNIEQYAENITKLLSDKELCLKIGSAAKKRVEEKFNIKNQVEMILEYYNKQILLFNER
jgi:glycosyltransferase involved in cell wall biosynthesis